MFQPQFFVRCLVAGLFVSATLYTCLLPSAQAADEFTGKFEPQLAANQEDLDHVIFKPFDTSSARLPQPVERGATVTGARLLHPPSEKQAMWALLIEPQDESPYIYVDGNLDG